MSSTNIPSGNRPALSLTPPLSPPGPADAPPAVPPPPSSAMAPHHIVAYLRGRAQHRRTVAAARYAHAHSALAALSPQAADALLLAFLRARLLASEPDIPDLDLAAGGSEPASDSDGDRTVVPDTGEDDWLSEPADGEDAYPGGYDDPTTGSATSAPPPPQWQEQAPAVAAVNGLLNRGPTPGPSRIWDAGRRAPEAAGGANAARPGRLPAVSPRPVWWPVVLEMQEPVMRPAAVGEIRSLRHAGALRPPTEMSGRDRRSGFRPRRDPSPGRYFEPFY